VLSNPDLHYEVARARLNERVAQAERERQADLARRAAPDFVAGSRLRDTAFWASIVGPLVGVGLVAYFAQVIGSSIG
jgi:hypothetical protein